jgi:hypothetical protein
MDWDADALRDIVRDYVIEHLAVAGKTFRAAAGADRKPKLGARFDSAQVGLISRA